MNITFRLILLLLAVSIAPAAVFALLCPAAPGTGCAQAFAAAGAAAAAAVFFAVRAVLSGLALPVARASSAVKDFIASDYNPGAVLPRQGWPEAGNLLSSLNRLMLELSAYRAFHLSEVVEERAKAQALIETITDGVMLVDDRGQLIYSNERALDLLRIPKSEPSIVLPGSVGQAAFLPALNAIMASAENSVKAEVSVPGTEEDFSPVKSFRVASRQFFLATLKRPGRVIVIRDVTVEKEIESARETLFYMITHDMRGPITSIQGYAQLIEKCVPSAPQLDKYLQAIISSSVRLNGMVEDILNTIKLEHGEMKLNLVEIDAGALCSRVFELYEPLASRKRIVFSTLPPAENTPVRGDAGLLERVLANLVGNSLKFTPAGGRVVISCRAAAGEMAFAVEDTGPGIPGDKQKEIFEKYSQLEEHKCMGFGLGLAMCKMAVELHKGRIWVESEAGKGSKFSFAVPLK